MNERRSSELRICEIEVKVRDLEKEKTLDVEVIGGFEKRIHELELRADELEKITTGKPREGYMGVIEIEPGTKTDIEGIDLAALSQKSWHAYAIDALNTLSNIADRETCRIDNRGFCRTHNYLEKPCPIGHARELLEEFSGELSRWASIKKELAQAQEKSQIKKEVC